LAELKVPELYYLQSNENLQSEDLYSLALTAVDDKWYDTSIKFFKGARELLLYNNQNSVFTNKSDSNNNNNNNNVHNKNIENSNKENNNKQNIANNKSKINNNNNNINKNTVIDSIKHDKNINIKNNNNNKQKGSNSSHVANSKSTTINNKNNINNKNKKDDKNSIHTKSSIENNKYNNNNIAQQSEILKRMNAKIEEVVKLHNNMLLRKKEHVGTDFKLFPYIIDEDTLTKKKKQPKSLKAINFFQRNATDLSEFLSGDKKEYSFRRICRLAVLL
jgi:hypothetical protein